MIVYVETNFVLELALEQGQHEACRELLDRAQGHPGNFELALPAFCVGEAYESWGRKLKQRDEARETAARAVEQVMRSAPYSARSKALRKMLDAVFLSVTEEQEQKLDRILGEVARAARLLPVAPAVLAQAQHSRKTRSFDRTQDALVYASVLSDLDAGGAPVRAAFVTKDRRDFHTNPDIRNDLRTRNCALMSRFSDARDFARSIHP